MENKNFLDSAYRKLTDQEFSQFELLYKNFVQKNSELNLSGIRDEQGIWEKHFYDSLLGAQFLENSGKRILDLGSGGGFPAFPLALMFREKQFFPFDSVAKKMRAVEEIAQKTAIPNIFPLSGRAEELGRAQKYREQFDLVTVRAFASFAVTLELALPLVKLPGKVIVYRGPEFDPEDELLVEACGGFVKTQKKAALPGGAERVIWEILKIYPTEPRFPRINGVPKKFPLTLKDL